MNHFLKLFGTIFIVTFAFSVTQAQERERKIRRDQLPPAVEQTVARESTGSTVKGVTTEVEHGQRVYEVSLNVEGHNKDILIDKNGNILEVEEQVTLESLPAAVQDALKKAAGTGTFGVIESMTKNGTLVGYEAHIRRGKKLLEVQVGPNGERLKLPE